MPWKESSVMEERLRFVARLTVGRHVGHGFGCDVAGGARPDLDEELLAKLFR